MLKQSVKFLQYLTFNCQDLKAIWVSETILTLKFNTQKRQIKGNLLIHAFLNVCVCVCVCVCV
jgi:hypothetical protein